MISLMSSRGHEEKKLILLQKVDKIDRQEQHTMARSKLVSRANKHRHSLSAARIAELFFFWAENRRL